MKGILKNSLRYGWGLVIGALVLFYFVRQSNMEKRITEHFINEYNVEVNVEFIKRALHIGLETYTYGAHLSNDPLASFQGYYRPKVDSFNPISMDYILFNSNHRRKMRSLIKEENTIFTSRIRIYDEVNEENNIGYSTSDLEELVIKYNESVISLHVYSFISKKQDFNWRELQILLDYLKKLPQFYKYYVNFTYYPLELLNKEDVRANKFSFGFNYYGHETCFEGWNLDKRLDNFEVRNSSLDSLLIKWEEKLKEVDERKLRN